MIKKDSKRVNLSIPPLIFGKIEEEKNKHAYTSHQEVILQILREHYFRLKDSSVLITNQQKKKKEKRGRPPKLDELKILSTKRIFSKKGKPYEI